MKNIWNIWRDEKKKQWKGRKLKAAKGDVWLSSMSMSNREWIDRLTVVFPCMCAFTLGFTVEKNNDLYEIVRNGSHFAMKNSEITLNKLHTSKVKETI